MTTFANTPLRTTLTRLIMVLRLVFGPTVFLFPRFTAVMTVFLDWLDGEFFKRAGYDYSQYSFYDKITDYYWYIWIILYVFIQDLPYKYLFLFLFLIRTIGQYTFLKTHKRYLLFLFPNVFEVVFFYYLAVVPPGSRTSSYFEFPILGYALICIVLFALIRETIIHIRKKGVFTGNASYWSAVSLNANKVFIVIALVLAVGLSVTTLTTQKSVYKTQAEKAIKNGKILTYSPTGEITGYLIGPKEGTYQYFLFNTPAMEQPICQGSLTTRYNSERNNSYFLLQSDCFKFLPKNSYSLIVQLREKESYLIEFTVTQ